MSKENFAYTSLEKDLNNYKTPIIFNKAISFGEGMVKQIIRSIK